MNSGSRFQRSEHIWMHLGKNTPAAKFLNEMRKLYSWASNELRLYGKGADLIFQVVHQVFKDKNKRTTGQCAVQSATSPNHQFQFVQKNRFSMEPAQRPTLEKFILKTEELNPNGRDAKLVIRAFNQLTEVFSMPATVIDDIPVNALKQNISDEMRILDFWKSKIRCNAEIKYFDRSMRALLFANIYDDTPIDEGSYKYSLQPTA